MAIERFEDLDLTRRYTYDEYYSWKFPERVELLGGWVERIVQPGTYPNLVRGRLLIALMDHLETISCEVLTAPLDVVLARFEQWDTVVQPDILVVCDTTKIKKQHIDGAPDFIIEIGSPGNGAKELDRKYKQYQDAGVKEYWVVHPDDKTVLRYVLDGDGLYVGQQPCSVDTPEIASTIFEGFVLSGAQIFP